MRSHAVPASLLFGTVFSFIVVFGCSSDQGEVPGVGGAYNSTTAFGGNGNTTAAGGSNTGATSSVIGTSGTSTTNTVVSESFAFGVPPAASHYFKRGLSLGNRLDAPNEGDWGGTILETDFPFISARGFDHVRIPIKFSGHALTASPYTLDTTFMARVDTVIEQALSANLAVLVDFQAYDELATNVNAHKERYLALWSQLAEHFQQLPESVAFELFNEPHGQLDSVWNELLAETVKIVRTTNPRRLIVADAVFWADSSRLSDLVLPDDANILAAVHLYEPKLFSFQGQSWMGAAYMTTGVVFPGPPTTPVTPVAAASAASWAKSWFDAYNTQPAETNPSGPATIDTQIARLESYRKSQGREVYNGEWGPQDGGDEASRVNLITYMRERCETAGIGWAIWEDPLNMSLFDSKAGTWNTKLVDALLPR